MIDIIEDYMRRFPHDGYLHYHAPRYSSLLRFIKENYKKKDFVLDIGRSRLTEIISDALKTPVDSLGFHPDSDTASGKHYHFDLNNGGRVILQTPNAVALHKRLKMLIGKNPYERIRENNSNPGHFREYTKKEIMEYAKNTGFKIKKSVYENYFDYRFLSHTSNSMSCKPQQKLFNYIYSLCPGCFKPGMTLVLVKEHESDFLL